MNELQQKRKALGLTQAQTAKACGVSRRTYQTYEEANIKNDTFNELLNKLDQMGILDGSNHILNLKFIKYQAGNIFSKYPEVKCAYLYGSYARGEATGKSDVDILVVIDKPIGLRYFGIGERLKEILHKEVDVQSYEQLVNNATMLKDILVEGIKIYG